MTDSVCLSPKMSPEELIDSYCRAWSDPDPVVRKAFLAGVWAEGAVYVDPPAHPSGFIELLDHIERVQAQRPGAQVLRTSRVDVHHDVARFTWHVQLADGSTLPEGIDFVDLTADRQQIRRVVGFFGSL